LFVDSHFVRCSNVIPAARTAFHAKDGGGLVRTFGRRILGIVFALCALAGGGAAALADPKIGSVAAVVNDVSRELAGDKSALKAGDAVFRNEIVRTAAASKVKLTFLDSTNLVVGPSSEMTLDEFVYAGPTAPPEEQAKQKVQVSLTRGVFRFTTGSLEKKAYLISTPVASVAVQGTVLDIDALEANSRVTLVEGKALVCARKPGVTFEQQRRACGKGAPRGAHCDCIGLDIPGSTAAVVRTASGENRAMVSASAVDATAMCAGSFCSGGGSLASRLGGSGRFPAGALCGH
jgi:hypothetical protein